MITPWRYALVSAEFKKKVLPIFLAFKLVTIQVFSCCGWPYFVFLWVSFIVEHVEGVCVLGMLIFASVYLQQATSSPASTA